MLRRRPHRAPLALLIALLLSPPATPAGAQTLREKVAELFRYGDCGAPLCLQTQGNGHGDHFIPGTVAGNLAMLNFITGAIGTNVANIPVPSTSGGATFSFVNGMPVRTSVSAGPFIGERAPTLGRGRVLAGANVTSIKFTNLRGVRLTDLPFDFAHQDVGAAQLGDPDFENDVIRTRTSLSVSLLVTTLYLTYGLSDRVDVGIAAPLVHTTLSGHSTAQIDPFGTTAVHFFAGTPQNPVLRATSAVDGTATGVGDVTARMKINFSQTPHAGLSALAEVHLPTGDENDFLGSGGTTVRALGIFSSRLGAFTPHLNAGYLYRGGDRANSAFLTTLGFDQLLAPWATFALDVLSESQIGQNKLDVPGPIVFEAPYNRSTPSTSIPNIRDDIRNASMGIKFTTGRGLTVLVNSIFPLNSGGMRSDATWTAGVEYNF